MLFIEFCKKNCHDLIKVLCILLCTATVLINNTTPAISSEHTSSYELICLVAGDPSVNEELIEDFMKEGLEDFKKGDYYGALASFESVLQLNPSHREALKYRQLCREKLGISPRPLTGKSPVPGKTPGTSAHPEPTTTPSHLTTGTRSYRNNDYGFTVSVPTQWKERRQGSEIHFTSPEGDTCGINLLVKTISCRQGFKECQRLLGRSLKGFTSSPSKSSSHGDQDIEICNYTRDGKRKGILTFVHLYRFGFILYGDADEGRFPAFEKAFQNAINSFAIIEPEGTVGYERWTTKKTPHFVFYAPSGSFPAQAIDRIGKAHEEAYTTITEKTAITLGKPISFFLYPDDATLLAMTRRDSGFAIAEEYEVHSLWKSMHDHQTTGHEMTHVITGQGWGKPCNALMGEGIAVYLDLSGRDLYREARELMKQHGAPDIETLSGEKWFSLKNEVAYRVSGAFCRYIAETYGFNTIKRLYQSRDFKKELEKITGKSQKACMENFRKAVEK